MGRAEGARERRAGRDRIGMMIRIRESKLFLGQSTDLLLDGSWRIARASRLTNAESGSRDDSIHGRLVHVVRVPRRMGGSARHAIGGTSSVAKMAPACEGCTSRTRRRCSVLDV